MSPSCCQEKKQFGYDIETCINVSLYCSGHGYFNQSQAAYIWNQYKVGKKTAKLQIWYELFRSCHPQVFIGKGVLKICSKFTGEHPC